MSKTSDRRGELHETFILEQLADSVDYYGQKGKLEEHTELSNLALMGFDSAVERTVMLSAERQNAGVLRAAWTTAAMMITSLLGTLSGIEDTIDRIEGRTG